MKLSKRSIYILLVIILTITVDQVSKVLVRAKFEYGEKLALLGNVDDTKAKFLMQYVENKGAFLGMGSDLNPTLRIILLLILPVVVLGYVLIHLFKNKDLDNLSLFAFASIVGGGLANVYDRIVYGKVTDFLFIDLGGIFKTGIFNMADLFVTTGIIILVIVSFRKKKTPELKE